MYTNVPAVAFAATLLTLLMSLAMPAHAAKACARSALDMAQSCNFEVMEEHSATLANCRQLATADERKDCRREARDERLDARATCGDQLEARRDACELLAENRYLDPLSDDSIPFVDPDDIGDGGLANNPYVILQAGHTHVLAADGEIVVVHVTDDVREIQERLCRVIADIVVEEEFDDETGEWDYIPVEVTDDWMAQDAFANVFYCGEVARNFEDGVLRDLDGSFEAGLDFAKGGFLTKSLPVLDDAHRQEYALGEAEDIVHYFELDTSPTAAEGGENPAFPCNGNCLKTFEFSPLEPDASEFKYYLPGVGFVLAVGLEDGELTGEREELVCVGDSLDVLEDDACGIEDPEALRERLCELHPGFCDEGEG